MPYIPQEERKEYSALLHNLAGKLHAKPIGHFTYVLYFIAMNYIYSIGLSYANLSAVIGAVNDTAHELRRRVLDLYEDKKRQENGDID